MGKVINIIFPHQLFSESILLKNDHEIYLIEEHLFFQEFNFHKQKIAFHRASMKSYEHFLIEHGKTVHYIESENKLSDIRYFSREIAAKSIKKISLIDPTDDWLEQRIAKLSENCELEIHENPQFLRMKDLMSKL